MKKNDFLFKLKIPISFLDEMAKKKLREIQFDTSRSNVIFLFESYVYSDPTDTSQKTLFILFSKSITTSQRSQSCSSGSLSQKNKIKSHWNRRHEELSKHGVKLKLKYAEQTTTCQTAIYIRKQIKDVVAPERAIWIDSH